MADITEKALPATSAPANFIRNIVNENKASNKWGGRVATRFPPEPNGYLHIGHAKSICLNFGLARDYGGVCHLRFDDTNPAREDQEYVDSIIDAVHWLGFDWKEDLFYASDYFGNLYEFAEHLILQGKAYVNSLSAEQIREYRGTLTQPGKASPHRDRSVEQNLELFRRMKAAAFKDGEHVLRLKIDMSSPNINLRDPVIYRIRYAYHHRTGNEWCIYPLYDYAHAVSDAMERITHSICTLEFEDHRPLYDWILDQLYDLIEWHPQQIEFARLNLTYVVVSKRKLLQLVEEKHVEGWDDPRMPTLAGARRRGYTPEGIQLFCERIGVSKADSWIDYSVLEDCIREDLNEKAPRRMAVLKPLKLIIDNYPEEKEEECFAANHPLKPEMGKRILPFSRELWIEQEDFMEVPAKGYFRLSPGKEVRLRSGFVVKCTGYEKASSGEIIAVHCDYYPDSKSGTPGSDNYKVKGNIHWVSRAHAFRTEVRLYDRLFSVPTPGSKKARQEAVAPTGVAVTDEMGKAHVIDTEEYNWLDDLNPRSKEALAAFLEPSLREVAPEARFQFERHGYFVADRVDSKPGRPVFNRTVTLRDSWNK